MTDSSSTPEPLEDPVEGIVERVMAGQAGEVVLLEHGGITYRFEKQILGGVTTPSYVAIRFGTDPRRRPYDINLVPDYYDDTCWDEPTARAKVAALVAAIFADREFFRLQCGHRIDSFSKDLRPPVD